MLNGLKLPTGQAQINSILDGKYIPLTLESQARSMHDENEEQAHQSQYVQYREYYDGEHDTQLTERIKQFLGIKGDDVDFNANYCPIVVDALAERLKVTGFDAGDQGEILWQWWRDNRMDAQQGVVHTGAVRDGDFYEMVEWDNRENRPRFTYEMACTADGGVKVHYSKERRNKIAYASKRWMMDGGSQGKARRLNLYFEDHIEKYIADGGSTYEGNWRPYLEVDPGEAQGIEAPGMLGVCGWYWWTSTGAQGGDALGVPVVHFKNKDQGYERGQSELKNVIPLQNALNKSLIDLLGAADTSGFPMYTGTGDKFANMTVSPGRFLWSEAPEARIGRLEASDLKPMIEVKDSFAMEIARVSRTPISYFQTTSQLPAEGSEQQREVSLVAKGEKCTTDFGNAWEDMMTIARRLHNAFGTGGKLDETQRIEAQWKPLQSRNELTHLQTLTLKKQLGVSDDLIWGEMGYDAEQIQKMTATKLKNARVFASAVAPAQTGQQQDQTAQNGQGGQQTPPSGGNGSGNRFIPGQGMAEMNRL